MKKIPYILVLLLLLSACRSEEKKEPLPSTAPVISNNGHTILFPDSSNLSFFKTEKVRSGDLEAEFTAPANIAATIVPSREGANQNIVLFEDPELASNYTQLLQHQININQIQNVNIRQKQLELDRTKDLNAHGTATGQELMNAESALSMERSLLANEKAALVEHESKLITAGFSPELFRRSKAGTAYLISGIPETHIDKIGEGSDCTIVFHAFPDKVFTGKIDAIADVVDASTRMVKVRISVGNTSKKLKAGMFANVSFNLSGGNHIGISKNSLVTIQGNHFVFIKNADDTFERTQIQIGQQIGDRIVVYSGLSDNDEIAVEGVMQLKGLSFGY